MLTRTMPAFAVANCVSAHSAQFGAQMPTRSPTSSPAVMNARASRSAVASSSAYVMRVPWWREMSAGWPGSSRAMRSRSAPIVSPMSGFDPMPLAYEGAMSRTLQTGDEQHFVPVGVEDAGDALAPGLVAGL